MVHSCYIGVGNFGRGWWERRKRDGEVEGGELGARRKWEGVRKEEVRWGKWERVVEKEKAGWGKW